MPKRTLVDRIRALDPVRDHQQIVFLDSAYEFPFDLARALEFALFRTYAVPSISALLAQTGAFERSPQKRYDDTDLIISEIYLHGYDSERGRAALKQMNRQHGHYTISNDDFIYVLSTFVLEPIRWMDRYGWRPFIEGERQAHYYLWQQIARYMNIRDLPPSLEALTVFNLAYERDHFQFRETNRLIGDKTRDLFLSWYMPRPLWKLGEPAIYAMMDDNLLRAFGYPSPPAALRALVQGGLRARSAVVRLLPERQRPFYRTQKRRPTYPDGYKIEELGARSD
jgi:hypothetical protein